jgi:transposase
MNLDPLQKNDIIWRWKSGQPMRAIARDLQLSRHGIASVIRQYLTLTQGSNEPAHPASLGPVPVTRKTKLDPFLDQLQQLFHRYPNLTAQRAFEELRKLGYAGSYSTLRIYIQEHRPKSKALTVRFETSPGVQAQMD